MKSMLLYAVLLVTLIQQATATFYVRQELYKGLNFFNNFNFWTAEDPTFGSVNYVDFQTAQSNGLIQSNLNKAYIRVDNHTVVPQGQNRQSIRLESKNKYRDGIIVFELSHMPVGKGTWPAFWTVGDNWPVEGEIDILEGSNDHGSNAATLHTGPGCSVSSLNAGLEQTGNTLTNDCYAYATNDNVGCSVNFGSTGSGASSYGPALNNVGGGWYVMERKSGYIKIWWFPRNGNVPLALRLGSPIIATTLDFGVPQAKFVPNTCNFGAMFAPHRIVLNTDLCGSMGGAIFSQLFGGSCDDFVRNNPGAMSDAYWEVDGVSIFMPVGP